jgi:hypothetical protein
MSSPRPNWGGWERDTAENEMIGRSPEEHSWPWLLGALVFLLGLAGVVAAVITQ